VIADHGARSALSELTSRIVDSYRQLPMIEHLDRAPLPSPRAVADIAHDLEQLIFPGYEPPRSLAWSNITRHVAERLESVENRLAEQIARALLHAERGVKLSENESENGDDEAESLGSRAHRKAVVFLQSLPRLRRLIATDVQAAFDGDPAARSADEIVACYPGLEAVTVYRLAHELFCLQIPLLPRMMTEWVHGRTGIDVHPGARIGAGFFIDHGTGVVIGETCEIADRVKLYQGVTLGALSFETDAHGNLVRGTKRHPTIERNVVIYANATILGGQTVIGAHSVIGAGVTVTKSVVPKTVVTLEKPSLRFRAAS
jgi:serine O-acetyltransferase